MGHEPKVHSYIGRAGTQIAFSHGHNLRWWLDPQIKPPQACLQEGEAEGHGVGLIISQKVQIPAFSSSLTNMRQSPITQTSWVAVSSPGNHNPTLQGGWEDYMTTHVQCLPHSTRATNDCSLCCLTPEVAVILYFCPKDYAIKKRKAANMTLQKDWLQED